MRRLMISAAICCGLTATLLAQAPGTVIETDGTLMRNRAMLKQAAALREAGELLTEAAVRSQLAEPTPSAIAFPVPSRRRLTARQVAEVARAAMVRVGWYGRRGEKGRWELHLTGGYAVTADGVVATCHHCVIPMKGLHDACLVAVDTTGKVRAVTAVLATNKVLDACLVRVAGEPLKPLPLTDNVAVGDAAFCFSDPFDQHGYFSEGIVNRFYWLRKKRGEPNTLGEFQFLRINVSTDWAPGSSGAAILDGYGNAIGHVARISPLTLDGPAVTETEEEAGANTPNEPRTGKHVASSETTIMVVHEAIPARGILSMAGAWSAERAASLAATRVTPTTPATPKTPEPAEPTLKIGMPAPPLKVASWVQGEPVTQFDRDHAYVVEFWATWCGPCRTSIPHLNKLHQAFAEKGLIVIGQDCWERDESLIEPFLKEMGDKMTYRVAMDDKTTDEKGAMARTWMDAAGQSGIPSAFIVDKQQRIAWIGHPMDLDEALLSAVLNGTYDIEQAQREFAEKQAFLKLARDQMRKISTAMAAKDWDSAEQLAAEFEKAAPPRYRTTARFQQLRVATAKPNAAAINRLAALISEDEKITGMMLNQLAWQMVLLTKVEGIDLELAERLARRGVELCEDAQKSAVLDTLARVLYRQGKKDEAIATQKDAIERASETQRPSLQKTLEAYEGGKLPDADE